jgi:hypothetical protein
MKLTIMANKSKVKDVDCYFLNQKMIHPMHVLYLCEKQTIYAIKTMFSNQDMRQT